MRKRTLLAASLLVVAVVAGLAVWEMRPKLLEGARTTSRSDYILENFELTSLDAKATALLHQVGATHVWLSLSHIDSHALAVAGPPEAHDAHVATLLGDCFKEAHSWLAHAPGAAAIVRRWTVCAAAKQLLPRSTSCIVRFSMTYCGSSA